MQAHLLEAGSSRGADAQYRQSRCGVLRHDEPQPGGHRVRQPVEEADGRRVRVVGVLQDQHGVAEKGQERPDRTGQQAAPHFRVVGRRGWPRQPVGQLGYDEADDAGHRGQRPGGKSGAVGQCGEGFGHGTQWHRRGVTAGVRPARVCRCRVRAGGGACPAQVGPLGELRLRQHLVDQS